MQAPDLTEKIIGYRTWCIDARSLLLRASGAGGLSIPAWKPGVNTAVCESDAYRDLLNAREIPQGDHDLAPYPECMCGLYAWHAPESLAHSSSGFIGAITAWGLVEVHAEGFRAQYAEIVALAFRPSEKWSDVKEKERLAEMYGVPLVHINKLEATAAKAGAPVPESMRPEDERKKRAEEDRRARVERLRQLQQQLSPRERQSMHQNWGTTPASYGAPPRWSRHSAYAARTPYPAYFGSANTLRGPSSPTITRRKPWWRLSRG